MSKTRKRFTARLRTRWRNITNFTTVERAFGGNGSVASGGAVIDAQGFISGKYRAFKPVSRPQGVVNRKLTSKTQPKGWPILENTVTAVYDITDADHQWVSNNRIMVSFMRPEGHSFQTYLYDSTGTTWIENTGGSHDPGGGAVSHTTNLHGLPLGSLVASTSYILRITTTRTSDGGTITVDHPFATP
jgi:hypothetical protein